MSSLAAAKKRTCGTWILRIPEFQELNLPLRALNCA